MNANVQFERDPTDNEPSKPYEQVLFIIDFIFSYRVSSDKF